MTQRSRNQRVHGGECLCPHGAWALPGGHGRACHLGQAYRAGGRGRWAGWSRAGRGGSRRWLGPPERSGPWTSKRPRTAALTSTARSRSADHRPYPQTSLIV
eukprot:874454-Rhodomonas_salina.2